MTFAQTFLDTESVFHLVVNGHLMSEQDRAALVAELVAALPELYETARQERLAA